MSPQGSPAVSVIVVSWNSGPHLPVCLAALEAQTFRDFEVIVVDNASTDGCVDRLAGRYPGLGLRVERLVSNSGFASANNFGARLAKGTFLALLNPDAYPEPDWLANLLRAASVAGPGVFFASRQLQANSPDRLDGEGDEYHVSGLAWRRHYGWPADIPHEPREPFSACAAAAMYPRVDFLDTGGFDERYFAYLEDVDLGFRLRLRGLRCVVVHEAVVRHVGTASTGKGGDFAVYHGHRNMVWTYVKDMPTLLFWVYLPLTIAMNAFFLLSFSLQGRPGVIWRAKWDALRGLTAILAGRRLVQSERKASTAAIHAAMRRNLLAPLEARRGRSS